MGDPDHPIGQKLLLAFDGFEAPSAELLNSIRSIRPAGFTLFRSLNIESAQQVRALTGRLQQFARENDLPPFLICADQEGGQLMALGDGTPLPGNMALGATRSVELAYKAGRVLGAELSAVGINVNYAPCADVNNNPKNPVIGTRSFGDDPRLVGSLASAMIEGIQSQGVAATVKHFPGHGDTQADSHLGFSMLTHDLARLNAVEIPPFSASIQADVRLMMTAHLGIQAIDGEQALPATLSRRVLHDLLREKLGFRGVVISDAMDMGAIEQGDRLGGQAVKACQAGIDLLLLTGNTDDHRRVFNALHDALEQGDLNPESVQISLERIAALKQWISAQLTQPALSVVRSAEHLGVADEIAERSITLVRDRQNLLPLQLSPGKRVAVLVPEPQNLTPADTSSYVKPGLAEALSAYHPGVQCFTIPFSPGAEERNAIIESLRGFDLIIAGTINACSTPDQAALIRELTQTNIPLVVVAMRLPYDLEEFPQVSTYLCCYSILEPSMRAVAKGLFGKILMEGQLPVCVRENL
jgi:beta-N-acetylhexosaminidase